jgi:hypothetical protein
MCGPHILLVCSVSGFESSGESSWISLRFCKGKFSFASFHQSQVGFEAPNESQVVKSESGRSFSNHPSLTSKTNLPIELPHNFHCCSVYQTFINFHSTNNNGSQQIVDRESRFGWKARVDAVRMTREFSRLFFVY